MLLDRAVDLVCAPHWLQIINALIALAGAGVAFGAANRMDRHTERPIILAFATVGAGLLGFAGGTWLPQSWQAVCETLLVGGVCALLVGTRRQTLWIKPFWMPRLSLAITGITWGVFFVGVR